MGDIFPPDSSRPPRTEVVEAVIGAVRSQGEVLLLRRRPHDRSYPNAWCFPGGRLDYVSGGGLELPTQALVREVFEEAGIIADVHDFMGFFDSPWPERNRIYRVHCYLLATRDRAVRLSDEHTAFCWVGKWDASPTPLAGPATEWLLRQVFEDG